MAAPDASFHPSAASAAVSAAAASRADLPTLAADLPDARADPNTSPMATMAVTAVIEAPSALCPPAVEPADPSAASVGVSAAAAARADLPTLPVDLQSPCAHPQDSMESHADPKTSPMATMDVTAVIEAHSALRTPAVATKDPSAPSAGVSAAAAARADLPKLPADVRAPCADPKTSPMATMAATAVIEAPSALRTPAVAPEDPSAATAGVSEAAAAHADLPTLPADLRAPCGDPQDAEPAASFLLPSLPPFPEMDHDAVVPSQMAVASKVPSPESVGVLGAGGHLWMNWM
jgi:hypothetical protein